MSDPSVAPLLAPDAPPESLARRTLLKRLADVVCLPGSRINAFERAVTGDLLVELLREAEPEERLRVARRLATLSEIPDSLVRLMLRDDSGAADLLLEESGALSDSDLIACAYEADVAQRLVMAARRNLSNAVGDALTAKGEPPVMERLLRNTTAKLSQAAIEEMVTASRDVAGLTDLLLKRAELRPSSAYVMFWWCGPENRRVILSRFAVSREVLQEVVDDVFAMAARENWADPLARKALQFIERRQRNRAAVEKSPFDSLDHAIQAAAEHGLTRDLVAEISHLAGIKPTTGGKIMGDPGGEPLAVICKATGLPREAIRHLWRATRRPETDSSGDVNPQLEHVLITHDMISVDRAQTVLRYWNWSLSSALTPALMKAIRDGDEEALDEYSVPQRAAMLALADDMS